MSTSAAEADKSGRTPLKLVSASEPGNQMHWLKAVGAGWRNLVKPLIELCDAKNYVILQVKEKYGTLRFYWSYGKGRPDNGDIDEAMESAVERAEANSCRTCEVCGKYAELRNTGGWLSTLCDACIAKE